VAAVEGDDRHLSAYTHVPRQALLEAVDALREQGFRISADGVGDGDMPCGCSRAPRPAWGDWTRHSGAPSSAASMPTLCDESGALPAVEGAETEGQCAVAARAQLERSGLFVPSARLPAADVHVPPRSPARWPRRVPDRRCGSSSGPPRHCPSRHPQGRGEPADRIAGRVRGAVRGHHRVPVRSVHRSRFPLSIRDGGAGAATGRDERGTRRGHRWGRLPRARRSRRSRSAGRHGAGRSLAGGSPTGLTGSRRCCARRAA
jgi:hypothetical protein